MTDVMAVIAWGIIILVAFIMFVKWFINLTRGLEHYDNTGDWNG